MECCFCMSLRKFLSVAAIGCGLSGSVLAQNARLHLRPGVLEVPRSAHIEFNASTIDALDGRCRGILVFTEIPDQEAQKQWQTLGLRFDAYLPDRAYQVSFAPELVSELQRRSAEWVAFVALSPEFKIQPELSAGDVHPDARSVEGHLRVWVHVDRALGARGALEAIQAVGGRPDPLPGSEPHCMSAWIPSAQLRALAALPRVRFIEAFDPVQEAENLNGRAMHRVSSVQPGVGLGYDGSTVRVGLGDDGAIGPHPDYQGRIVYDRSSASSGDHGDHVAGTIFGAGNVDPDGMGMAPGAEMVYSSFPGNYNNIDADYVNYNVRITSSSYGSTCNGGYTSTSQQLDQDIVSNPKLMHVFSAGNSGSSDCGYGAGAGWGNITGGHKAGKNVIAVANLTSSDVVSSSSSRGPSADGRIKPDVSALGTSVYSSVTPQTYASYSGTSMACPGVSGSLAVLAQAFKVTQGSEPDGGLLKAILMNTAQDLGNAGPDFIHGYGRIDVRKAIELIENGQYLTGSIGQGGNQTHNIPLPAGVARLKVMVYWTDPAGNPLSAKALVNDLNTSLSNGGGAPLLPWVLNPTPNAVSLAAPAVRAVDSLNNAEQITVDNPGVGTRTLTVLGSSIPVGPQTYYVVYGYEYDAVHLDYPATGTVLEPGQTTQIRWSASSSSTAFSIQYSTNDGSSWTTLFIPVSGSRMQSWTVPATATSKARLRITRGAQTHTTEPFVVLGQPTVSLQWACQDSVSLSWTSVSGAVAYDVLRLGTRYMDSLVRVTGTTLVLNGQPSSEQWYSVRPVMADGTQGKRAYSVRRPSGNFNCLAICPVANLPYQCDFEANEFDCWQSSNSTFAYLKTDCPAAGNNEITVYGQAGLYLQSPQLNGSGQGNVWIRYRYYDPTASACGENADAGDQVQLGWVNASGVFAALKTYDGASGPASPTWDSVQVNVSGNATFRVRVQMLTGSGSSFDNWSFDDFGVRSNAPIVPVVAHDSVVAVSANMVMAYGQLSVPGTGLTQLGFCWNTAPAPTTVNSTALANPVAGPFALQLLALQPSTTYYVRPFAVYSGGVVYGTERSVTTWCTHPINVQVIEVESPFCAGDEAVVRASYSGGQGAKSILWSNGVTTRFNTYTAGSHWVEVTDTAGCTGRRTFVVSDPPGTAQATTLYQVYKMSPQSYLLNWQPVSLPVGSSLIGYRVAYRLRGTQAFNQLPLTTLTSAIVDFTGLGLCSGNYDFTVYVRYSEAGTPKTSAPACFLSKGYNAGSCKSEGVDFIADEVFHRAELFPNPSTGPVVLTGAMGEEVRILDAGGRLLWRGIPESAVLEWDWSHWARGVYVVQVEGSNGPQSLRMILQ
ncbi:S8 family serine peptidase [bacterium]|nr:S8 family serine peptidase [bacterium]